MNNCLSRDFPDTGAEGGETGPAAGARVVRRLIVVMLLTAAALDLTRCGLVMAAARHPAETAGLVTAGLVTAGLAAAALTARTARGCQAGRRWAGWAALLIGVASAPQAAMSGFRSPYLIPDTATAALGMLAGYHHPGDRWPVWTTETGHRKSSCRGQRRHLAPGGDGKIVERPTGCFRPRVSRPLPLTSPNALAVDRTRMCDSSASSTHAS
jgi:hypothetical protein